MSAETGIAAYLSVLADGLLQIVGYRIGHDGSLT
jgi:hypothetical protein